MVLVIHLSNLPPRHLTITKQLIAGKENNKHVVLRTLAIPSTFGSLVFQSSVLRAFNKAH